MYRKWEKNGSVLSSWSAQTVNSVYSTSSNQFCCNPADKKTRENTMSLAEVTSLQISLISEIQFSLETSAWKLLFLFCVISHRFVLTVFHYLHKHVRGNTNETVNEQTDSRDFLRHRHFNFKVWAPRIWAHLRKTLSTELTEAKERTVPPSAFDWQVNKGQREHRD